MYILLWRYNSVLDSFDDRTVILECLVIFLNIYYSYCMRLSCNLIQCIAAVVQLSHHKPIIRRWLVSRLKSRNDLPEISLPTETAFFNKTVKSFYFCITQSESNHIVSSPHFSSFRSWGLQGISPGKPHLEHQMLCLLY